MTGSAEVEYRAVFDAAITFSNGGGLQAQGIRVDVPSADVTEAEVAALFVASLGLLMTEEARITDLRIVVEPHKGTRGGPSAERARTADFEIGAHARAAGRGGEAGDAELRVLGAPEDWPLWRAARVAALADSPAAFPDAPTEWTAGGEERWREQLDDRSMLKIVAVVDDAPAGLVRAAPDGRTAWLHSLWVSPHLRGHGLGGRLIAAVEAWAAPDADEVRLDVVTTNEVAIGLYQRLGYDLVDEPAADPREVGMVKRLPPRGDEPRRDGSAPDV